MSGARGQKRILAIASGGGHWIQLYRLRPAFDGQRVTYASTAHGLGPGLVADARQRGEAEPSYVELPEANRWQKIKLVHLVFSIAWLVLRVRPHFVITTGAAHGVFALRFGKLIGARTIWIESIANADTMSMSGQLVRRHADIWLTQWEHLAKLPEGPEFRGAVL
jgi:UDP-N-acetylglucosamine:LPS N-acetylglucosamine transferase